MVATQDKDAPLVVIIGASGHQGGSVVRALLQSPRPYRLRCITRDRSRLQHLSHVDVVQLDMTLGQEAAITEAFKGADVVFGVTQYFEHWDQAREIAEGKLMIDCAKAAAAKLFIWSTLPALRKISNNGFPKVEFFDSKAEIADYGKASGLPFATVPCAFYTTNITDTAYFNAYAKQKDGSIEFTLNVDESLRIPVLDVDEDYGKYVRAVIEDDTLGAGTHLESGVDTSIAEMVAALKDATGRDIRYRQVSSEHFATVQLAQWGADKYWQIPGMFDYFSAYNLYGDHGEGSGRRDSLAILRRSGLEPRTFSQAVHHADLSGFDSF